MDIKKFGEKNKKWLLLYWAIIVIVFVAVILSLLRPVMSTATFIPVHDREGTLPPLEDTDVVRIDFVSAWDKIPAIEVFLATFEQEITTGSVDYEFYSSDILLAQGTVPHELLTDNTYVKFVLGDTPITPDSQCSLILRIREVSAPITFWSGPVEESQIKASVNEALSGSVPILIFHVYKQDWIITWDLLVLFSILLLPAVYLTFRNEREVPK